MEDITHKLENLHIPHRQALEKAVKEDNLTDVVKALNRFPPHHHGSQGHSQPTAATSHAHDDYRSLVHALVAGAAKDDDEIFSPILMSFMHFPISEEIRLRDLMDALYKSADAGAYAQTNKILAAIKKESAEHKVNPYYNYTGLFRALKICTAKVFSDEKALYVLEAVLDRSPHDGRHADTNALWEAINQLDVLSYSTCLTLLQVLRVKTPEEYIIKKIILVLRGPSHQRVSAGGHAGVQGHIVVGSSADTDPLLKEVMHLDVHSYQRCLITLNEVRLAEVEYQVRPILEAFVASAAHPRQSNRDLRTFLVSSAQHGHLEIFVSVLEKFKEIDENMRQCQQGLVQALFFSCQNGHFAIISKVLLALHSVKPDDCYHALKRLYRYLQTQRHKDNRKLHGHESSIVRPLLEQLILWGQISTADLQEQSHEWEQAVLPAYEKKCFGSDRALYKFLLASYDGQHRHVKSLMRDFYKGRAEWERKKGLCKALKVYSHDNHFEAVETILRAYSARSADDPEAHEEVWAALQASKSDSKVRDLLEEYYHKTVALKGWCITQTNGTVILFDSRFDQSCRIEVGDSQCPICYVPYADGHAVTKLPCKHWFCAACISHHLRRKHDCPTCRKKFGLADIRRIYQLDSHTPSS